MVTGMAGGSLKQGVKELMKGSKGVQQTPKNGGGGGLEP